MKQFLTITLCVLTCCLTAVGCTKSGNDSTNNTTQEINEVTSNEKSREKTKSEEAKVISETEPNKESSEESPIEEERGATMNMKINEISVLVEWEDNDAVKELMETTKSKPLTIMMSMYGGFEQVGSLGLTLSRNDKQTTTKAGDIVLYSGNQLVVFYGSNSWAYTRLGAIIDKSEQEMTDLLGNGNVTITIDNMKWNGYS